jgi:HlyD family secretion protein
MMTIDRPPGDLRALARGASAEDSPVGRASAVPTPKFPWMTRVVIPGLILVTLLALLGYAMQDAILPARAVKVVPVVVKTGVAGSTDRSGAPTATVQAPGWVEADPYPIAVSALADGIVKEMLALEGQSVKAGDVVARLVDDDAKLALARAEADAADKQARAEAAQRTWDHPVDRVRAVAVADATVAESKAALEKLNAEVAVESARLVSLKLEAERLAESYKTRATSEIESVRAQQQYEAQKAVLDSTRASRPVLEAQLAQREAESVAAKENLRLRIDEARMLAEAKAQLALSIAARDEARLRLSRMEVRSPADGIVMQRLAEPGAKFMVGMDDPRSAQAVRLYDPKRLQVRVDVPLADAAKVGVGQSATVVVGVLPDRSFNGRVSRIVNEADIQKNTLQVKVAIADPSPELKPEMLARVRFEIGGAQAGRDGATTQPTAARAGAQVVFAPIDLIHRTGDTAMAWVVDPRRGVATHRTIQLGNVQQDGWVAVTTGLMPGDQLIADNDGLRDGQRIRVVGEATLNTNTSKGGSHGSH